MEPLIKRDKFFVFKKNGEVEEYSILADALNVFDRQFVMIDKFKTFYSPSGGNSWRISEFRFLGDENQTFNLSDNNWTIHSIDTTYKSSVSTYFEISISDPTKRVRRLSFKLNAPKIYSDSNLNDTAIIQTVLDSLYKHSKFQSWEQKDLESINVSLKEKIKELEKQIQEMKSSMNGH
jgi:hypothetical protein